MAKAAASETVGDRVRAGRKRLELSQEQLAVRAGITSKTLQRIELNQHMGRSVRTLVKLAECLDVSPGYLLDGDDGKAA